MNKDFDFSNYSAAADMASGPDLSVAYLVELREKMGQSNLFTRIVERDPKEQFRFPKTKKRRIRNKWAKREENWRSLPIDYTVYSFEGVAYIDHRLMDLINEQLSR